MDRKPEQEEPSTAVSSAHLNWYEDWIDGLAGETLPKGRLIVIWVGSMMLFWGLAAVVGDDAQDDVVALAAFLSVPYWFVLVPMWARRRRRGRGGPA